MPLKNWQVQALSGNKPDLGFYAKEGKMHYMSHALDDPSAPVHAKDFGRRLRFHLG